MKILPSGAALLAVCMIAGTTAHAQVDCDEGWRFELSHHAPFEWIEAATLTETPSGVRLVALAHREPFGVRPVDPVVVVWDGHAWTELPPLPSELSNLEHCAIAASPAANGFECVIAGQLSFQPRANIGRATLFYRSGDSNWTIQPLPKDGNWAQVGVVAVETADAHEFLAFDAFPNWHMIGVAKLVDGAWSRLATVENGDEWSDTYGFVADSGDGERLHVSDQHRLAVVDSASGETTIVDPYNDAYTPLRGPGVVGREPSLLLNGGARLSNAHEPVRAVRQGVEKEALPPLPEDVRVFYAPPTPAGLPPAGASFLAPVCGREALVSFGSLSARQGTTVYARALGWNGSEMIRFGDGISFEGVHSVLHHRGSFYVVGAFSTVDNATVSGIARWGGASDPIACPADATGDGRVDFADLNAALASFGNHAAAREAGDVTGDALVDFSDLNDILSGFGAVCSQR